MNDSDIKLDAIFVGPQKTGTTWIYRSLYNHPALIFPKGVKETFFFDRRYKKGIIWYESHFKIKRKWQKCVEVAPTYFDIPEAAERIKKHYPDCKIVVTLRDPVEKAYSLYLHHKRKGRIKGSFRDALKSMPRLIESGHYSKYIPIWTKLFGDDRVLVILLDDIANEPMDVLIRVCEFMGIDKSFETSGITNKVNPSSIPYMPLIVNRLDLIAEWLRDKKIYFPIELAKKAGIKKLLFYKREHKEDDIDIDVMNILTECFEKDIEYTEKYLKRNLAGWHKYK